MAYSNPKKGQAVGVENEEKLRLYAAVVLVLIVVAAVTVLLAPSRGSGVVARCSSFLFQQDRYGCIESAAISTGNYTMCGALAGSYRDSCYLGIATNTESLELCGKINSTNVSNACYMYIANYTKNPSVCTEIGGALGSECAYRMALDTNNTKDCSLVSGAPGRLDCNATVDFNNALRYGDAASCAKIYTNNDTSASEEILQNSSISRYPDLVSNITQMLLEITAYYNQTLGARDLCYTSLAYESHNNTYCGEIRNATLDSFCARQVVKSALKNNTASNSTLNITALFDSCNGQQNATECRYTDMLIDAQVTGNITMCKDIPSNYSSVSAQCFYDLAEKYNSSVYCSYIANYTLNSACVGDVEGLYPNTNASDD